MTKEEVEQAFNGVSPYYAYKQGIQDGMVYNEESFRREAAKDILCARISGRVGCYNADGFVNTEMCRDAIKLADELIAKLKEK